MKRPVRARAYTSTSNLGYGLDVLGVCLDAAYDEVEIAPDETGGDKGEWSIRIEMSGDANDGISVQPSENTAGRAVSSLMSAHGLAESICIRIWKGTRPGSGLGSSAASAAAAIVAADGYFGLRLSRHEWVGHAAEGERAAAGAAHADNVSASLFGGCTIVDRSDPLSVVSIPAPSDLRFALVTPDVRVVTSEARAVLPKQVAIQQYILGCARTARIVAALCTGDIGALGRAVDGSFVDSTRMKLVDGASEAILAARAAGAAGAFVSGAGPTIAAVITADCDADAVAAAMTAAFQKSGHHASARIARPGPEACILEARP